MMGINLEIIILKLGTSGYRIFIVSVQYRRRDNQVLLSHNLNVSGLYNEMVLEMDQKVNKNIGYILL